MNNEFNVLIVDDEKTNVEYVSKLLCDLYKIKVAYNGKQALTIVKDISIDLILLDIKMPVMDGYEVIKELKKDSQTRDIPVVFLTSSKDNNTLVKVFELGAHDYIAKPFNKEELKTRVANHLTRYQLQKETLEQQELLNLLINSQSYMILLVNEKAIRYINKFALDFFDIKTIEEFKNKYNCICDIFIEDNAYFNLSKVPKDRYWVDVIKALPSEEQIVSIYSAKQKIKKSFKVNIDYLDKSKIYILTFLDISETMSRQFELEYKSYHDQLTKAYNREFFQQNYKSIIESHRVNKEQTTIAMIDIDHFKIVNDTYGHIVGDDVLKKLVVTIKERSRHSDNIIRWGGEEFLLIFSTKSFETLEKTLQNICDIIRETKFEVCKNITISIGASIYRDEEMIEETIKRSDEALYFSKRNGRDQIKIVK